MDRLRWNDDDNVYLHFSSFLDNSLHCSFLVSYAGLCHGGLYNALKKKEESERLRGERDQIKFIDLRFERWQVVRKARRQDFP